ncbi:MAG: SCE4755 family polysaccharide monooxygenase-like protein [Polyangiaceae bacterium]
MSSKWMAFAGAVVVCFGPATASAHINLMNPPPRYNFTGVNQKMGPCGGGTASGDVTTYEPGQEITVSWAETINHPGHFRVALDLTGADDFTDPTSENDMDVVGNIIAYVPDNGGSDFSHTFNLPMQECMGCTLQVIQVMTDKINGNGVPGFGGYPDNDDIYYWCADINIVSGDPSTSSSTTGGGGGSDPSGVGGADATTSGGTGAATPTTAGSGIMGDQLDNNSGGCSLVAGRKGSAGEGWLAVLLGLGLVGRLARRRGRPR